MKTFQFITMMAIGLINYSSSAQSSKSGELIKKYYTHLDAGNWMGVEQMITSQFTFSVPIVPQSMDFKGWKMMSQGFKSAFPDMKHEVIDWFGEGQKAVAKGIFVGTNTGPMNGNPATGKKANLPFTAIFEFDKMWKIVSLNVQFDNASFMKQLMPDMPSAETVKNNIKTAYESLNKRDYTSFKAVCTPDFTEYSAGPMPIKGVDAAIEAYKMFFSMAPDMNLKIKNITLDGNRAIIEMTITGTNTGMVMGMLPASGKKIMYDDIDIIVFDAQGNAISHQSAVPNESFYQMGYGALVNPNTGVIMDIYEKFGKGDIAGITANCAENVHWDISDNPFVKMPQIYNGSKEIPKFFGDLMASGEVTKFEPIRFLADGDDVFTKINVGFKSKENGKNWGSTFAHHFKLMNGKVVSFQEITTKPSEIK